LVTRQPIGLWIAGGISLFYDQIISSSVLLSGFMSLAIFSGPSIWRRSPWRSNFPCGDTGAASYPGEDTFREFKYSKTDVVLCRIRDLAVS
jgi:hypothetical protein